MPFNKFPSVTIQTTDTCHVGWEAIGSKLRDVCKSEGKTVIVVDCYQGVLIDSLIDSIVSQFPDALLIESSRAMKSSEEIETLTLPYTTDDRIFGFMSPLLLVEFFDEGKVDDLSSQITSSAASQVFVVGTGASLVAPSPDLVIYVDMARWEIQQRMRRQQVVNLGLSNQQEPFETQYKRGFFVDWRVCDRHKRELRQKWDYLLDTNDPGNPKLISGQMFEEALDQTINQPFSPVPFFDPGPWGGEWMRKQFQLDDAPPNFAWCFNCVPEENSLLLDFNGALFETPSINAVFFRPKELLGEAVHSRFGEEFPIRFDFLDTIDGGNLSLQVHPLTDYIKDKFGMEYTQDESYYMLDAKGEATVYLGLKDGVDSQAMVADLKKAQQNGHSFEADKYVEKWPAKKHDHFHIPAGTVHCSGKDCMVLEISATPYIFTFKLWDWGRLGLDGKPRPINIEHGESVIQWERQPEWTEKNLVNTIEQIGEGEGWREERTGLHDSEFIETRRHWHSVPVTHETNGNLHVLMLIDGEQAVVESPDTQFEPFEINYAEAFIIPANITRYSIKPNRLSEGKEIATIKAYVRT